MTAARSRISGHLSAIEAQVWQRMRAVVDGPAERHHRVSGVESILDALLLAERVGVFRYLSSKLSRRAR
jgi:hypothetical protein